MNSDVHLVSSNPNDFMHFSANDFFLKSDFNMVPMEIQLNEFSSQRKIVQI